MTKNAALYPDWSLVQHRSKSNNRSDEMLTQTDVGYWHFSEVVVPMRDVRSWRRTGSGQRCDEPTQLTRSRHATPFLIAA